MYASPNLLVRLWVRFRFLNTHHFFFRSLSSLYLCRYVEGLLIFLPFRVDSHLKGPKSYRTHTSQKWIYLYHVAADVVHHEHHQHHTYTPNCGFNNNMQLFLCTYSPFLFLLLYLTLSGFFFSSVHAVVFVRVHCIILLFVFEIQYACQWIKIRFIFLNLRVYVCICICIYVHVVVVVFRVGNTFLCSKACFSHQRKSISFAWLS